MRVVDHPVGGESAASGMPIASCVVRIRQGLIVACLVAMLAACSSEGDASPTLPPAPSASPTPAPALPVPPEATPETPQGAAAFARYYLDLLNRAFAAGDATAVRAVTTDECEGCQNLISAIERGDDPGEIATGGEYQVVFAEAPPVENGDVVVELRYALTEVEVRKADGSVETIPAKSGVDAQMRLLRRDGGWVVQGFRNVQP